MSRSQLRIYRGPEPESCDTLVEFSTGRQCVTVPVSDVLPLLADAISTDRAWLGDFEDDEITVSSDLYEVLLAYKHYRRPSA